MTELSLSAINATAPYHLRISELGGFDFDIDAGLTYNIALIEDYTFGEGFETFMLNVLPHSMEEYNRIKRDRSVKMRRDDKIRQTVMAVLEEALRHQNIIIDYVCMSEDERQDFRARLFSRWFRDYADDSKYSLLRTTEGFFKAIPSNYQAVHPDEEPILDAGFEKVLDDLLIPK